jgi:hypothetical protein
LRAILLLGLEHVFHVGSGFAVRAEQPLPFAEIVQARESLIDAQREGLASSLAENTKG